MKRLLISFFVVTLTAALTFSTTARAQDIPTWVTTSVDPTLFGAIQTLQNNWLKCKPLLGTNKKIAFRIPGTTQKVTCQGFKPGGTSTANFYYTPSQAAPVTGTLVQTLKFPPFNAAAATLYSAKININEGQISSPIELSMFSSLIVKFNKGKSFKIYSLDEVDTGGEPVYQQDSTTVTIKARK